VEHPLRFQREVFIICHISFLFFLISFWLPLEHGASMKLFVSLQFLNPGQSVGLLGRVISSSQDISTYTGQHKHRINVHIHINIHASSRIRTYDPVIQASQDSSCLRPLDCRDQHKLLYYIHFHCFLSNPTCYRIIRREHPLKPSPTNNTHKYSMLSPS
jgi:hypothetical protein